LYRGALVRLGSRGDYGAVNEAIRGGYRLSELDPPPQTILDVGAHIGAFAIDCHRRWADCEIICIEANARNIPLLRKNTEGLSGVSVIHAAVCYELEPLLENAVHRQGNSGGSRLVGAAKVERSDESYRGVNRVPAITLERVMGQHGWFQCDLLKLDCEGSELDILKHADLRFYRAIIGEYHDREAFLALMTSKAFPFRLELWPPLGEMGAFRFK